MQHWGTLAQTANTQGSQSRESAPPARHGSWAQAPVAQSSGHVWAFSDASQVPFGQVLGQSPGHVVVVSPLSQLPLPQQGLQSEGQVEQVSPALQSPSPHIGPPVEVDVLVLVDVGEPPVEGAPPSLDVPPCEGAPPWL